MAVILESETFVHEVVNEDNRCIFNNSGNPW